MEIILKGQSARFHAVRVDLGEVHYGTARPDDPVMSFTARDYLGNTITVFIPAGEAVALGAELVELGKANGVGG